MRAHRVFPSVVLIASLGACAPAKARPAAAAPTGSAARAAKPVTPEQRLQAGLEALATSRYAEAEPHLRAAAVGKQRGKALLGLAELQLMTGRYAEVVKTAQQAAASKDAKAEATWMAAEALRRQGKLAEAEAMARRVEKDPKARRARLVLGEILLEQGRESDAQTALMSLVEDYNEDRIDPSDGRSLAMVGRAAALLHYPRDANDAFNEAERASKGDPTLLLWRAELFLDKYDPGHAEEVTKEVLDKAPKHPEALVWMAHVKLAQALDFDEAERLAREALSINPRLPQAYVVLAGISLRDMELANAQQRVDDGLKHNPRDLDLLSMRAAAHFLADDSAKFEATTAEVLKLNPKYSRMYQIVGEYAEWEHRYDEIVRMMKKAISIEPEDAKAHAQLGLNLIRAGDDQEGVSALRTAFDKDPFNVRVFNTLNLYEKTIPRDYVTESNKLFTFRYHKEEKPILERYVPGLMERAFKKFVTGYGFTPKTPIGVELYAERQDFAIRTSGLPNTAIQGVCFGQTLAAMSPKKEKFNLGMTLWHELAHVFHIQLSKSHVPRWFTEGMAEFETLDEQAEWSREHDPALYEALRSKRLPQVAHMSRAFTRAEELSDVATAYYASSRILVMLVRQYGMAKASRMLKLWGEGKRTPDVVSSVLGKSTEAFDQEFRAFVGKDLSRYQTQFVPIERTGGYERAKEDAEKAPTDAMAQTKYALAALRNGKKKEADAALEAALKAKPGFPDALYIQARLAMGERKLKTATAHLTKLEQTADGFAVQMALGALSEVNKDPAGAKRHLTKAHQFDPTQSEPIAALVDLAKKSGDKDAELDGLKKLALLEEHDGTVYRRLMSAYIDRKQFKEAKEVGEQALWADIEDHRTHTLFAESLLALKMTPRAIYELETALLCPARPKDKADIHARLAEAYLAVPNRGQARKHAAEARKLDAENPRLKSLKL